MNTTPDLNTNLRRYQVNLYPKDDMNLWGQ